MAGNEEYTNWRDLYTVISPHHQAMWISFMAMLVYLFEGYALPGGFPVVMNIAWIPGEREKMHLTGGI